MGKQIALLLGFIFVFAATAKASDRYQELSALYSLYNQRFDSQGKYRPNPRLAEQFIIAQDEFVARMKSRGALQEILLAENNFDYKLWVRLYILEDEAGRLMTFFWEQGKYQDEEVRSFLRFRSLEATAQGLKFVPVLSTYAFVVKGISITADQGGSLQVIFLENIRKGTMSTQTLSLVKSEGRWVLQLEGAKPVSRAWIDVWVNLLPPNGGVRSVRLY